MCFILKAFVTSVRPLDRKEMSFSETIGQMCVDTKKKKRSKKPITK